MNYVDILILIPLAWAFYKGFKKGFVFEITTLIALILGLFFGYQLALPFSELITQYLNTSPSTSTIISFFAVFVIIVLSVFLLGKIIESIINLIALGLVNKFLGAIFALVKVTLVISFILYGINSLENDIKLIPEKVKSKSVLYKPMSSFSTQLLSLI